MVYYDGKNGLGQTIALALDAEYEKALAAKTPETALTTYLVFEQNHIPPTSTDPSHLAVMLKAYPTLTTYKYKAENLDVSKIDGAVVLLDSINPVGNYDWEDRDKGTNRSFRGRVWGMFERVLEHQAPTPYFALSKGYTVVRDSNGRPEAKTLYIYKEEYVFEPERLAFVPKTPRLDAFEPRTLIALSNLERHMAIVSTPDVTELIIRYTTTLLKAVLRRRRNTLDDSIFFLFLRSANFRETERKLRKKLLRLTVQEVSLIVDTIEIDRKALAKSNKDEATDLRHVLETLKAFIIELHSEYFQGLQAVSEGRQAPETKT